MPPDSGTSTSEFKITVVIIVIGTLMEGFSAFLTQLQTVNPAATWIGTSLAICGALLIVLKALGYSNGRVALKMASMAATNGPASPPQTLAVTATTSAAPPS